MTQAEQRAAVVAEARSWIRTPWAHAQMLKGAGCDCAMLLVAAFTKSGIVEPFDPRPYPKAWFLHRDEPIFLEHILKRGKEVFPFSDGTFPQPADIILWKLGRQFAHAGIVTEWPYVVHAFAEEGIVTETNVDLAGVMTSTKHPRRFFSAWG